MYRYYTTKLTWNTAYRFCKDAVNGVNGSLARFDLHTERNIILKMISDKNVNM